MLVAYGRTQASGSPTKSSNPSPNTPAPSRVQKIQRHRIQSNGSCVSSARQPQPRDGRGPRTHAFHRPRVWWTSRAAPEDDGRAARCCVPGPRPAGRRGSRGSELVDSPVRRQAGGLGRRTRRRRAPAGSTSHRPMPLYPSPGRAPRSPPRAAPVGEADGGPTLRPSVGNWQHACQSHYLITRGEVLWCNQWSAEEIAAGRRGEEERRREYYEAIDRQRGGVVQKLWRWMKSLFER